MQALNTFPIYQLFFCIEIHEVTLIFHIFPFMSFQPSGILTHNSLLSRALRPVIAKARVSVIRFFFKRLGYLFNCADHLR